MILYLSMIGRTALPHWRTKIQTHNSQLAATHVHTIAIQCNTINYIQNHSINVSGIIKVGVIVTSVVPLSPKALG